MMYREKRDSELYLPTLFKIVFCFLPPVAGYILAKLSDRAEEVKSYQELFNGDWEAIKSDPTGKWLYFLINYSKVNKILLLILVAFAAAFFLHRIISNIRIRYVNKPKSTSLSIDSYLIYHHFSELQKKMPELSETELSELASAVFVDLSLVKNNKMNYDRLRPFCTEQFFDRFCNSSVDIIDNATVLSARPYAWKKIVDDHTDNRYQIVIKVNAQSAIKESIRTKEYDLYFLSIDHNIHREITNCPHCGGVVDFAKSNRCSYCDTELSRYLADWILEDIKEIR